MRWARAYWIYQTERHISSAGATGAVRACSNQAGMPPRTASGAEQPFCDGEIQR